MLERSVRVEAALGPELKILISRESFPYPWLTVKKFFKLFLDDTEGRNRWTRLKMEAFGLTNIVYFFIYIMEGVHH
jgi:hypothetical protein